MTEGQIFVCGLIVGACWALIITGSNFIGLLYTLEVRLRLRQRRKAQIKALEFQRAETLKARRLQFIEIAFQVAPLMIEKAIEFARTRGLENPKPTEPGGVTHDDKPSSAEVDSTKRYLKPKRVYERDGKIIREGDWMIPKQEEPTTTPKIGDACIQQGYACTVVSLENQTFTAKISETDEEISGIPFSDFRPGITTILRHLKEQKQNGLH